MILYQRDALQVMETDQKWIVKTMISDTQACVESTSMHKKNPHLEKLKTF